MIVVESGSAKLHQWVNEEQNIDKDYEKAFGDELPMISGVAIITDTDETSESATAYYGDIVFRRWTVNLSIFPLLTSFLKALNRPSRK